MYKVIVLDNIAQEGLDLLDAAEGIEYEVRTKLAGEELRSALAEFDGAICRSGVKITAESLEGNKRLKAIVRAGVGTDNIDKTASTRRGIIVMNTPAGNTLSTAEHTFALMLGLSRNVAPAHQSLKEHRWDRKAYMGTQLADKTLGVVGLGRIGQEVAKRARAFEMKVVGFDPFISAERAAELGIELVSQVTDMLPLIDYMTVHTPLTPETKGLINTSNLDKLKNGVRLVNCARGGIYSEAALIEGLKSGKIAGVALDVFDDEPCTESPLFEMDGVLCTPHLGASTEEAQTQVAVEAVQLLTNFLQTGEIRHAVNMAALDPKTLESLKGYLDIAYRLGRLLAQLNPEKAVSCKLIYRGEVADQNTKLLTSSFCAGLIEDAMQEEANIVNAQVILQDRGIQVSSESSSDRGAFNASVTAEVVTDGGRTLTASGTLFGNNMPRLIRLEDYRLEAYLDGVLFVFRHNDVPGIIGNVGSIFGKHNINIAQMAVGRSAPGGDAVGVMNLDSPPSQATIDDILSHPHITEIRLVQLPAAGQLPPWM
ncbi:MAG: phosphoglycerate dehydrogenase [Planctomycetales bacterium]|nr:phosphoglycerate dehydrogenase [Planctomycetales bacterium]